MIYTKEISAKVDLVNGVLDEIRAPHLLESPDFSVDEMSREFWLKINLNDGGYKKVPLSLTFTQTGLEIRLDRISEAIDWSDKDINEYRSVILTMLKNLFTSHILVEYHGSSRTSIRLFGQDGKCNNSFKYYEGFSLIGKRKARLYHPVY